MKPNLTDDQWIALNIVERPHSESSADEFDFSISDLNALAREGCIGFTEHGFDVTPRGRCWVERWRKEQVQRLVSQ